MECNILFRDIQTQGLQYDDKLVIPIQSIKVTFFITMEERVGGGRNDKFLNDIYVVQLH